MTIFPTAILQPPPSPNDMTTRKRGFRFRRTLFVVALLSSGLFACGSAFGQEMKVPTVILKGVPFTVSVEANGNEMSGLTLEVDGKSYPVSVANGVGTVPDVVSEAGRPSFVLKRNGTTISESTGEGIPGWVSILPALLAIVTALAFRRVIPALFVGLWLGAWWAYGGTLAGLWQGLLDVVQVYVIQALVDADHVAIIVFSLMIGGMVGIISRNGGTQGIVESLSRIAKTARRGQVATGLLGLSIFFDDYANTLIVGNTMRPLTDRLKISREKLAYVVDSTAAPVATIALVTTWVGFQVGLIGSATQGLNGFSESGYSVFLASIGYSFYPIMTLAFVFMISLSGRDFGPMLKAERRARTTGQVSDPDAPANVASKELDDIAVKDPDKSRALNAVIPVAVMLVVTLVYIYVTGKESLGAGSHSIRDIIGAGDSYRAMIYGSLLSVLVAAALSLAQRLLSLSEVVESWYAGLRSMLMAVIILVLAWSLASVNEALHTSDFLVSILGDTLPAWLLPTTIFILSGFTAFATGSSWGVMGIMIPLVVPLAWAIVTQEGASMGVFYASVAGVLSGAVWGDHCSPISDTTILSSLASSCDHMDHVRTQLPYAVTVGSVAMIVGLIPVGFGAPWWICLIVGLAVLGSVIRFFGKRIEVPSTG